MKRFAALILALCLSLSPAAWAVNPDEVLSDPALEARAREISSELRCLVCQNQSIDDSDADLARDLRVLVRERLVAGDTDEQAMAYIVDRYGEFVLLRPVLGWHTLVLWIAAPALLVGGAVVIFFAIRRRKPVLDASELTDEEQAALAALEDKTAGS